jgi:signal peptidase I
VGAEDRGNPPLIGVPRKMTDRTGGGQPRQSLPGKKGAHGLLDLFLVLALSLVFVFGAVRPFVAEPFYVSSRSMLPTLKPHDRVLAAKFSYHLGKPRRGDLVVFENPENRKENLIKRVVGLPGDTVAIKDAVLYVNGERVKEPYVNYRLIDASYFGPVVVPVGCVFTMGDNRANSVDSRSFGPVPEKDLLGRVTLRLWPLDRAGDV